MTCGTCFGRKWVWVTGIDGEADRDTCDECRGTGQERPATTRPCALCDEPTTGSVGAAGIKWAAICQPCKDREDRALSGRVEAMGELSDRVFAKLFGSRNRG